MTKLEKGNAKEDIGKFYTYGNQQTGTTGYQGGQKGQGVYNPDQFNEMMQVAANSGNGDVLDKGVVHQDVEYADQLQPFDITINFANETGAKAKMSLYGCEILNEGMGFSIQDLSTNVQYSFVARDLEELHRD